MSSSSSKTALIEIGGSHGECLYSQILMMRQGGREPLVILSEELRPMAQRWGENLELHYLSWDRKSRIQTWKTLWKIRKIILDRGVRELVLNTAQSNLARNFCLLPFPGRIGFAGTLHDMGKLRPLGSQWQISQRVRHYFVLNDYLLDHPALQRFPRLQFSSYYPLYFPPVAKAWEKPPGEIWIAIPGKLEFGRRDYGLLLQAISRLPLPEISRLRFLILGQSAHAYGDRNRFLEELKRLGGQSLFQTWEGFLPDDLLHAGIQAADWVMPLNPGRGPQGPSPYLYRQVSGAFNLAFGFRKPMILHQDYASLEDFRHQNLFYQESSLADLLLKIARGELRPILPPWPQKFSLERQSAKYNGFLDQLHPPVSKRSSTANETQ